MPSSFEIEGNEIKKNPYAIILSILSLSIALVSLIIAAISLYFTHWGKPTGEVTPFTPAGYGIIYGAYCDYIKKYSGPSDHIFIQSEWINTTGRYVTITNCFLELHKITINGDVPKVDEGDKRIYYMAGEFPAISDEILRKDYIISNSLILPPNSCTKK